MDEDISVGSSVKKGKLLGLVSGTRDSSFHQLHFEVKKQGNLIDPLLVFSQQND